MHSTIESFPEPLSRDLAFILGLDRPPASVVLGGDPPARSPKSVAGSATVGFSALAALLVGATATVVSYWPAAREDDAPTSPSSMSYDPAPSAFKAAIPAPLRPTTLGTTPVASATLAEPDQVPAIGRTGAPAGLSVRSPVGEQPRLRTKPRVMAADDGGPTDDLGGGRFAALRTSDPIAEEVSMGRSATDASVAPSTPKNSLGASVMAQTVSSASAATSPPPVPITRLGAARRDAQDALVGLRRQL